MMKKSKLGILTLALSLLAVGTSVGQSFFGIKAGAVVANVDNQANGVKIDTKSNIDLQIGLALDLGIIPSFSIQPEITYLGRSYKATLLTQEIKQSFSYVDVGALAKIRFGVENPISAYIGAGPFLNYALSGKTTIGNEEEKIVFGDTEIKRTDFSIAGALGLLFNFGKTAFYVDGRYILGLGDIDQSNNSEVKNRTIGITAGIMFPL